MNWGPDFQFIAGSAAGAATAVAYPALAQESKKVYRIGYLAGEASPKLNLYRRTRVPSGDESIWIS